MKSPWSFPTSPRSPYKVIERLRLIQSLDGKEYNKNLQVEIGKIIRSEKNSHKVGLNSNSSTLDLVGRDYITRAPKKLGIVYVPKSGKGKFLITEQGKNLINSKNIEFIMQRQIAKIQYPSPISVRGTEKIKIIPLTTIIKVLKEVKSLSRSEIMLFVITIEEYTRIDNAINEIKDFRYQLSLINGNLNRRKFRKSIGIKKLEEFYSDEDFKLRETKGKEIDKNTFLKTKLNNHKDYADSIFRYFISTGLFKINKKSRLEISKINEKDVDFLLNNIGIKPQKINVNEEKYIKNFMGKEKSISIFTDNLKNLNDKFYYIKKLSTKLNLGINIDSIEKKFSQEKSLDIKKDIIVDLQREFILLKMKNFIKELSKRKGIDFTQIINLFDDINDRSSDILDKPLQYEYNFFKAFSFIGGAEEIIPSLKFDEDTNPLNTTSNKPDLIIKYKQFVLVVEVTLSTGQRQYESESIPVFRHVGKCQNDYDLPVYGLFIAEKMDENIPIAFLGMSMVNTKIYNGKVRILPLERKDFICLFNKIHNEKLDNTYIFKLLNEFLNDDALNKYQKLGEEEWIKDFKSNFTKVI